MMSSDDTVKRDDIIEALKRASGVVDDTVDTLSAITKIVSKDNNLFDKDIQQTIRLINTAGFKAKNISTGVKDVKRFLLDINTGIQLLSDYVDTNVGEYILLDNMTPRLAAVMDTGSQLTNITNVLSSMTTTMLYTLQGQPSYYKIKLKELDASLKATSIPVKYYLGMKPRDIIKKIETLSDASVNPNDLNTDDLTINDKRFNLPMNKFTGNPIYHIRQWWQDWQIDRYEARKEDAKLTALKIAELQTKANGDNPPVNIQQQIEYYEDKLHKLEIKIKKFEED